MMMDLEMIKLMIIILVTFTALFFVLLSIAKMPLITVKKTK